MLEKSTIYHGWEYVRDIFPESKANDKFMGNNKGFLGKEPEVYIGIISDGVKKRELFVFNQAFLNKYSNEIAYYTTPQPVKVNGAKDLEWSQVKPTVSPQGIKQYDELYPGIYYQKRRVSNTKDMMRGSPEKEIGIQIRKTA